MILHHGCSHIRKSAGRSLFAAHRSLSQLVTSFIGSQCQGILHMLFFAWTTFMFWSYEQSSDCSGLNITVLVIAWIAVFHTLQLLGAVFYLPLLAKLFRFTLLVWRKNLISINRFLCFFPLLCLSCMSHWFFSESICLVSYSVFNELQLNFH